MNCSVCRQEIYRLCTSQGCDEQAQFCDNRRCDAYKKHINCYSLIYPQCLDIENQIQRNEKEFVRKINLLLVEFVEEIKLSLNQRTGRKYCKKLGKVINKVKRDGRVRERRRLTGRQVKEAWDQAQNMRDTRQLFDRCYQEFRQVIEGLRRKIFQQKQRCIGVMVDESPAEENLQGEELIDEDSPFVDANGVNLGSEAQIISPPRQPIDQAPRENEAFIYLPEASKEEFLNEANKQFVIDSFGQERVVKGIKKVFTASARQNVVSNKLSSLELYKKCGDLKNPLLIIKYVYLPFNEIFLFGAWTPLQYGEGDKHFIADPTGQSRIFWFDQRLTFPLVKQEEHTKRAVYTDKSFGIVFGNDLHVKSDGRCSNAINIGKNYSNSHLTLEQRQRLLACQKKIHTRGEVLDYQVYQIEFEGENNEL